MVKITVPKTVCPFEISSNFRTKRKWAHIMGTVKITVDTVNGHTDFLAVRGGRGDPNYIGSKYLLLCVIMLLFPFEDPNVAF